VSEIVRIPLTGEERRNRIFYLKWELAKTGLRAPEYMSMSRELRELEALPPSPAPSQQDVRLLRPQGPCTVVSLSDYSSRHR
jgi:hypothetical protein